MSPKPLHTPDSSPEEKPSSGSEGAPEAPAVQEGTGTPTPKEGGPVGGLAFPDWDILPPNRVINPRIRNK